MFLYLIVGFKYVSSKYTHMASTQDLEDAIVDLQQEISDLRAEIKELIQKCAVGKAKTKRKASAYSLCVGEFMKKNAGGVKNPEERKSLFKRAAQSCKKR